MIVKSRRWERTVRFKAWSDGKDKSFIVITYPKKDKGSTFLRIKTDMWQYVPKIEKTIKIPPSMMLQSWMGSDFTNDDLVKESSVVNDYTHALLREEEQAYVVESVPRPDAAIVWGKIIQWIDKKKFVPVKDEFYDEDGLMVRRILYNDVKQLPDRYYPMRWEVEPLTEEKKGHKTTIIISEIELNMPIEEDVFTMRALKDYSR
jgi:outer membrane lipoprotein-sorting protein